MKYKVVKLASQDIILFVNTVIDILVHIVNGVIMWILQVIAFLVILDFLTVLVAINHIVIIVKMDTT